MSNVSEATFIVPAAGTGERMGGDVPKQYLQVGGLTILDHTIAKLLSLKPARLVLVVAPDDHAWKNLVHAADCQIVMGGQSRSESVMNALGAVDLAAQDWVLVHDAARPCISPSDIERLFQACCEDEVGGLLGCAAVDTIKQVDADGRVIGTIPRHTCWHAQTPQMFRFGILTRALGDALAKGCEITDEASAVELAGLQPKMVEGCPDNLKITVPADLQRAATILGLR